jgi:MFS family permease
VLLRTRQAGGGRRPGDRAPRDAELLLLLVGAGCAGGMGNGLATFTVDAAVTGGMAQGTAGLLLSLGAGVAIATRLSSGWVADRRDSAGFAELATLMLVGAGGTILLAFGDAHPALVVAGTLVAFAGAWGWQGLVYYAVVKRYPESPAASTGLVQSGVYLGTILGPPLIGHLATASSYRVAWTAAAGLLAAGAAGVVLTRHLAARRPRSTLPAGGDPAG